MKAFKPLPVAKWHSEFLQDTKYRNLIKRNNVLVIAVQRYLCPSVNPMTRIEFNLKSNPNIYTL